MGLCGGADTLGRWKFMIDHLIIRLLSAIRRHEEEEEEEEARAAGSSCVLGQIPSSSINIQFAMDYHGTRRKKIERPEEVQKKKTTGKRWMVRDGWMDGLLVTSI